MNELDNPNYYLINDYLKDKLSDEESRQLETELKENTNLQEEVFFCKLAQELIIEERYAHIAKSIRSNLPVFSL
ncbi:MAG TPA: hypothetical protein VIK89_02050 [Cytophagaceae bacterium]